MSPHKACLKQTLLKGEFMKTVLGLIILATLSANAASPYEMYYTDGNAKMTAEKALVESIKGTPIYKCQSVDFKVSKTGGSISLKNVKKPKSTTEEITQSVK